MLIVHIWVKLFLDENGEWSLIPLDQTQTRNINYGLNAYVKQSKNIY
jgi:hypothetical protein